MIIIRILKEHTEKGEENHRHGVPPPYSHSYYSILFKSIELKYFFPADPGRQNSGGFFPSMANSALQLAILLNTKIPKYLSDGQFDYCYY